MGEFDLTGDETFHVRRPEGDAGADTFPTTTAAVAALGGGGGGGGSAGSPIVRKFPFAFNTPNILTGADIYTPTIGDVLLDAWFEGVTVWDGTTPLVDIGSFDGDIIGLYAWNNVLSTDLTHLPAIAPHVGTGIEWSSHNSDPHFVLSLTTPGASSNNPAPGAKFTTADPLKILVSQDGTLGGPDPGSTQGAAILYVVTCTPV